MPRSTRRRAPLVHLVGTSTLFVLLATQAVAGPRNGDASAGGARTAVADVSEGGRPGVDHVHRRDVLIGWPNADHDDSYIYRLPYGDGISFQVLQGYGARLSHRGSEYFTVDFSMAEGTLVHAARDGVVALVEDSFTEACWADGCGRFANFIVVLHADGTTGEYFHLQHASALVVPGDAVRRGQPIARSGNTGYTTAPHLHFGVYRAGVDGSTQSVAVRFLARQGVIGEPRNGARYENARDVTRPPD